MFDVVSLLVDIFQLGRSIGGRASLIFTGRLEPQRMRPTMVESEERMVESSSDEGDLKSFYFEKLLTELWFLAPLNQGDQPS